MTGSFSDADVELLQRHLQAIVEVEFFTIPLYLTAVYSFTEIALEAPSTLYTVQQEALSVAVQEMYHLQCACNILNAFTVTPTIPKLTIPAGTDLPIPHLVQNGRPLTTRLGALPAAIASMIDIESPIPTPSSRRPTTPSSTPRYRISMRPRSPSSAATSLRSTSCLRRWTPTSNPTTSRSTSSGSTRRTSTRPSPADPTSPR